MMRDTTAPTFRSETTAAPPRVRERRLLDRLRKGAFLAKDRRGSVALIVALSLSAMLSSLGFGLDLSRTTLVKSRLHYAVDAAVLAASSQLGQLTTEAQLNAYARRWFNLNFPDGFMGVRSNNLTFNLTARNDPGTGVPRYVNVVASANVPTLLIGVFNNGITSIRTARSSEAERENRGVEVVIALDTTGSMNTNDAGGKTRIQAARDAISLFFDVLYGADASGAKYDTRPNLWVALVPFSNTVNIGTARTNWLATNSLSATGLGGSWLGCVDERSDPAPITSRNYRLDDTPPSTRPFDAFKITNQGYANGTASGAAYPQSQLGCGAAVLPMRTSRKSIEDAVKAINPAGGTMIHLGVAWGWRAVSARWQGVWQATGGPQPIRSDIDKVMILMTDGDNGLFGPDSPCDTLVTQFGPDPGRRIPCGRNTPGSLNDLNELTAEACRMVKADNIKLYTIAFGNAVKNSTDVQNLLRNCASSTNQYFPAFDEATLRAAFRTIGAELSKLRLTK